MEQDDLEYSVFSGVLFSRQSAFRIRRFWLTFAVKVSYCDNPFAVVLPASVFDLNNFTFLTTAWILKKNTEMFLMRPSTKRCTHILCFEYSRHIKQLFFFQNTTYVFFSFCFLLTALNALKQIFEFRPILRFGNNISIQRQHLLKFSWTQLLHKNFVWSFVWRLAMSFIYRL